MKTESSGNPAFVLLTTAVAAAVFCAVFMWNPPSPRFYPMERVWRMPSEPASGPAMGWYGRTGTALLAAAVVSGAAAIGLRTRAASRRIALSRSAVYAIAVVVAATLASSFAGIAYEQRAWFSKPPSVPEPDHEY
ncbi:MAG: hypothetical protein HUU46_20635 [Candidatus Hydrogenedentes bacterium]|nr:hypothetical protein [Candidatus Hydrogenedentota bacterium]